MKTVTISEDEARRILNLMRGLQMELGEINSALPPDAAPDLMIRTNEFAGELHALVTGLEGSLFEVDFPAQDDELPPGILN